MTGIAALLAVLVHDQAVGSEATAVLSIVKKRCVECHGPDAQEGDVRFDKLAGSPQEEGIWASILEQLEQDAMPPKDEPRLSREEHSTFTAWIKQSFPRAAQALAEKMQQPENGNLVPHDKLFDPKVAARAPKIAASPARVWRTLPQSYEQKQEAWLNARGVRVAMKVGQDKKYGYLPAPFGLHTKAELKNYSFRYSLAGSQTEGLANNARSLLDLVIKANPGGRMEGDCLYSPSLRPTARAYSSSGLLGLRARLVRTASRICCNN